MRNNWKDFRQTADAHMADIVWTAQMSEAVRHRACARRNAARGKRAVAVALVLAVALLATTALALGLTNGLFELAIDMETQHGSFETWSLAEKLQLLDLFAEGGYALDAERLAQAHDEARSEAERDALATALIMDEFANGSDRVDAFSMFDIMETVKGPIAFWSLEDMAWYSAYLREHAGAFDVGYDMVPGEDDLTREEAVARAANAIIAAYELEADALSGLRPSVQFYASKPDGEPHWQISFYNENMAEQYATVWLTREGKPMACEALGVLLPEDAAAKEREQRERAEREAQEQRRKVPPVDENSVRISEEQAREQASAAVAEEFGVPEAELGGFTAQTQLVVMDDPDGTRYWSHFVMFKTPDGATAYSADVRADTGEVTAVMIGEGNG